MGEAVAVTLAAAAATASRSRPNVGQEPESQREWYAPHCRRGAGSGGTGGGGRGDGGGRDDDAGGAQACRGKRYGKIMTEGALHVSRYTQCGSQRSYGCCI